MKIVNVAGARPNFMKIAPLISEMKKYPEINQIFVHTGQHYDEKMSTLFFKDLEMPEPDIYLGIGSASHAEQTAKIMIAFENVLLKIKPDLTVVVGDVNSTIACALVSVKLGIPVAHVEAGLRSFDRTMPEEINRIVTDSISDYLFTTERNAKINLLREGIPKEKIFFTGNVMIDSLLNNKNKAEESKILERLELLPKSYCVLTLHRPSNVDNLDNFYKILEAVEEIHKNISIVYPVHPRTKKQIELHNLSSNFNFLKSSLLIEPLGYIDFLKLVSNAKLVLTDSGGIQEETTVLNIPCITLRNNTERPVTVEEGTNIIAGINKNNIVNETLKIINSSSKKSSIPELWDGKASKRIIEILLNSFNEKNASSFIENKTGGYI